MDRLPYPVLPALPPPRRQRRGFPWALGFLFLAAFLASLAGGFWYLAAPTGRTAIVRVPEGAGAAAIGALLEHEGIVRSGWVFALLARATGAEKKLKSGVFRLEGRGTLAVLKELEAPRPLTVRLTFPEGWRAVDYARRLREAGFDGEGFLALAERPPEALKPPYDEGPTLEGYLFPDTYEIPLGTGPEAIVRLMLRRFAKELTPEREARLSVLGLSVHAWVTLASIVQAEAGSEEEMPWIAGVFLNRLEIGMPLQSDPTVAYALGKDLPELDRRAGDFEADSPYNTYRYPGLPPGPINNPGSAALASVLNARRLSPKGKPYLYFFHARGKLYLNETFAGHLRDLNRYRYGR